LHPIAPLQIIAPKYKYPPDEQKDVVEMVLRQAEVISEDALAA